MGFWMGGFKFLGLVWLALALSGCRSDSFPDSSHPANPRLLVDEDLKLLSVLDQKAFARYDREHRGVVQAIFGGTTAAHIRSYLDQRIHFYFSEEEMAGAQVFPQSFKYENFLKVSKGPRHTLFNSALEAENIGTELWFLGVVNNILSRVVIGGTAIPIRSTRTGIVVLGSGYSSRIQLKDGEANLPSVYRQAVLIHEARHSDCAHGLTSTQMQALAVAPDDRVTQAVVGNDGCGHLHSVCPAGHSLAGLSQCDDKPWGAYNIEAVYLEASLPQQSGEDRAVLEATLIDVTSRLQFDLKEMVSTDGLLHPDMSSEGAQP